MARQLPSDVYITNVSVTNYHRAYSTESISGIVDSVDSGVQWFHGDLELTAVGYNATRSLNGFLASLKGRVGRFEIKLGGAYSLAELPFNPTLNVDHSKGAKTLSVNHSGMSVPFGSVFTVPNDPKVYTFLDNLSGVGTYEVIPALKTAQVSGVPLNFKSPVFTAVLTTNETTITSEENGLINKATIQWRETIV
jgi:hypothetical protein